MPTPVSLLLEACSQNPSAIIDLFTLDMTKMQGPVLHFHAGNYQWIFDVDFQSIEYAAWPVKCNGFEWTTTGTQPRPTITFSNVLGTFTQLNLQFGGLVGCLLTRIRTFAKFLDHMPYADPSAAFPAESWVINRKTDENRITCTYELANPMDFEDLVLPRRRILADLCQWDYRGNGCGYTGPVFADEFDAPFPDNVFYGEWATYVNYWYGLTVRVSFPSAPQFFVSLYPSGPGYGGPQTPPAVGSSNYWKRDVCSLRLSGCKLRFGNSGQLPFGGFPGTRETPISPAP